MLGIHLQLFDGTTEQASLTNIQAMWWDVTEPKDGDRPIGKTDSATTDTSGYIDLDLSSVSGLSIGGEGFLMLYKLDAIDHEDSLVFAGKVTTSNITSGVDMYYYDSGWTRPTDWPSMSDPANGTQKIQALYPVHNIETAANAVAFVVEAAYTVNWGDGSTAEDFATGVTATHTYNYSDADFTSSSIVGRSDTTAVTFTDTGNLVNLTGHAYVDDQEVMFATITTTTGITTYTSYYVVSAATNTFQVSATKGGTALTLTTDGSGTIFVPKYKCAVITITPQTSNNITKFDANVVPTGFNSNYRYPYLDLRINSEYLTTLDVSELTLMKQCWIGEHALTAMSYMFYNCYNLQSVPLFNTASCTTMLQMFQNCYSLQSVPLFNTASCTTMQQMFYYCYNLQSVPLFNTASCTTMYRMFYYCYSLQSVPLFNTASCTTMSYMFSSCYSLQSVPLFNTASCTTMNQMFSSCYGLQLVPLFNTASCTTMYRMFYYCRSLQSVPLFNTASCTTIYQMFFYCSSLQLVPLLDASALTADPSTIFYGCFSLREVILDEFSGYNLNVNDCSLGSDALDALYTGLGDGTGMTLTCSANWGYAASTTSIATTKNWTLA